MDNLTCSSDGIIYIAGFLYIDNHQYATFSALIKYVTDTQCHWVECSEIIQDLIIGSEMSAHLCRLLDKYVSGR